MKASNTPLYLGKLLHHPASLYQIPIDYCNITSAGEATALPSPTTTLRIPMRKPFGSLNLLRYKLLTSIPASQKRPGNQKSHILLPMEFQKILAEMGRIRGVSAHRILLQDWQGTCPAH